MSHSGRLHPPPLVHPVDPLRVPFALPLGLRFQVVSGHEVRRTRRFRPVGTLVDCAAWFGRHLVVPPSQVLPVVAVAMIGPVASRQVRKSRRATACAAAGCWRSAIFAGALPAPEKKTVCVCFFFVEDFRRRVLRGSLIRWPNRAQEECIETGHCSSSYCCSWHSRRRHWPPRPKSTRTPEQLPATMLRTPLSHCSVANVAADLDRRVSSAMGSANALSAMPRRRSERRRERQRGAQ